MAHATSITQAPSHSFISGLIAALKGAFASHAKARSAEATYAALSRLSAHELADIGLTRDGIWEAAVNSAK